MSYNGKDRRIHSVYVTRNTEYHLRRDECVAVRDRNSGEWIAQHAALQRTVAGSLTFLSNGGMAGETGLPDVGEALCFHGSGLVTSAVVAIERPPKQVVSAYER